MSDIPTTDEALANLTMPLLDAMMTQRAIRRVKPDPVDDAIVLKCIELALRAPTGSNGQNWEFIVVKDQRIKDQFAKRYRQAWSLYGAIAKRVAAGDEASEKMLRAGQWQIDHFEEIPVLVVPCLRGGTRPPYHALAVRGRVVVLRVDLPQRAEPAARRPGDGPRRLADHPAAVERDVGAQDPSPTADGHAGVHRPAGLAEGTLRPHHPQAGQDVVHLDQYGNRAWLNP